MAELAAGSSDPSDNPSAALCFGGVCRRLLAASRINLHFPDESAHIGTRFAPNPSMTDHARRRLALPKPVRHWSQSTLREKLFKIGAKVTRHLKYVFFQLAEVAVTRNLFAGILDRIARLAIPRPLGGPQGAGLRLSSVGF